MLENSYNNGYIYELSFLNGKYKYVGSTNNTRLRYNHHNHYLRVGKHHNNIMQNIYNKYNQYPTFKILAIIPEEKLLETEQVYINSKYFNLNIAKIANKPPGTRRRRVIQYDLDGNFIKIHDSIISAANLIKRDRSRITAILKDNKLYCGGYQWILYKKNYKLKIEPYISIAYNAKPIILFDRNMQLIKEFSTTTECCKYLNLNNPNMINYHLKKGGLYKNEYYFKYK